MQASGPISISTRKLLREAYLGRSIPGLNTHRDTIPKKPPLSVRVPLLYPQHLQIADEKKDAATSALEFTFPESAPPVISRLIETICEKLLIGAISLALAHVALLLRTQPDRLVWSSLWSHLLSNDLGVVFLWGVLIGLFQQLLSPGHCSLSAREIWATEFKSYTLSGLVIAAAVSLSPLEIGSTEIVVAVALSFALSAGWRARPKLRTQTRLESCPQDKNVLIVGAGYLGREIADFLTRNKGRGRVLKGFLDDDCIQDPRVLGGIEDLAEVARDEFADEIIVVLSRDKQRSHTAIIEGLRNHLDVRIVPELFEPYTSDLCIPLPVLPLHQEPIPELGFLAKRGMDLILASAGLVVLLPLLALLATAIFVDSPAPVLYRSSRVGRKGRRFSCLKFRTMVPEADRARETLRARNERCGPLFKLSNDPRITTVGRFLRRYSLDELPQLWNVIRGEMSLVGPRPHPLDDYQRYSLQHLRRLDVTPGITGLWQVTARRDPSFYKNMELDLQYIDRWSLWLDVKILVQTIKAVLMGTGV